jgi:hypothetical protein
VARQAEVLRVLWKHRHDGLAYRAFNSCFTLARPGVPLESAWVPEFGKPGIAERIEEVRMGIVARVLRLPHVLNVMDYLSQRLKE